MKLTNVPTRDWDKSYKIVVKNGNIISITVDSNGDRRDISKIMLRFENPVILINNNFDIIADAKSISREHDDEITVNYSLESGYWYRSSWDSELEWIETTY